MQYLIAENITYTDNYQYDDELQLQDNLILRISYHQFNTVLSFFKQYPANYWRIIRISLPHNNSVKPAIIFDSLELVYQKLSEYEYPYEYVPEIIRQDNDGTVFINIANTLSRHILRLRLSADKKQAKTYPIKRANQV